MQAIDRTHRLGQFKPIYATRFIIEDTVEERIIKLQVRAHRNDGEPRWYLTHVRCGQKAAVPFLVVVRHRQTRIQTSLSLLAFEGRKLPVRRIADTT